MRSKGSSLPSHHRFKVNLNEDNPVTQSFVQSNATDQSLEFRPLLVPTSNFSKKATLRFLNSSRMIPPLLHDLVLPLQDPSTLSFNQLA